MSESIYTPVVDAFTGFPVVASDTRRPSSGSVEWLLDAIERHAVAEQDALQLYDYLRTASGDPVVAVVMQLILEDEERHHGLLKRIEATLRDAIDWTHSPDALPTPVTPSQPVLQALIDTSRVLIKEERSGAHYLRDLARRETSGSSGLTGLLIEMMAMDSDKHARLLQFVHDRLAGRPREEDGPGD